MKEAARIDCCKEGEKHCLPTRVGDTDPDVDVIICSGSVKDRGRLASVIMASGSGSSCAFRQTSK